MPIDNQLKLQAKAEYDAYATAQKQSFIPPNVTISYDTDGENSTSVLMDVTYNGIDYRLRSMQRSDKYMVFCYLNSQPLVRAQFANGQTVSWQDTTKRVNTFCDRFVPPKKAEETDDSYLWSAFAVADNETDAFLGYANLGLGEKKGFTEMAYLNRADAWSCTTPEIVQQYEMDLNDKIKLTKPYKGLATAEVSSLLQYAEYLKHAKRRTIGHEEVIGVAATAQIKNLGSWKACAKHGMEVTDIDANLKYGPELRYQLLFKLN